MPKKVKKEQPPKNKKLKKMEEISAKIKEDEDDIAIDKNVGPE